jgi:hypothetical protein
MACLVTREGAEVLIDDQDYAWAQRYAWSLNNAGYPQCWRGFLHRLVAGAQKGEYVDHRKGNKLDCRRSELRLCRQSENAMNRRKAGNCSSRFKGVSWDKARGKWRARMVSRQSGRLIHLGYFGDEVQAATAYDEAARFQYGEFALTNFEVGTDVNCSAGPLVGIYPVPSSG